MKTLAEAAVILGINAATLRQQVHRGRFMARHLGPIWIVSEQEIRRYRRDSLGRPGRHHKEDWPTRLP